MTFPTNASVVVFSNTTLWKLSNNSMCYLCNIILGFSILLSQIEILGVFAFYVWMVRNAFGVIWCMSRCWHATFLTFHMLTFLPRMICQFLNCFWATSVAKCFAICKTEECDPSLQPLSSFEAFSIAVRTGQQNCFVAFKIHYLQQQQKPDVWMQSGLLIMCKHCTGHTRCHMANGHTALPMAKLMQFLFHSKLVTQKKICVSCCKPLNTAQPVNHWQHCY